MTPEQRHDIKQLIREVVSEAVPVTVHQTFELFGFTVDNPPEMQKDMAHLRKMRQGSEQIKSVVIKTSVGAAVTGFLYLTWEIIKYKASGGK